MRKRSSISLAATGYRVDELVEIIETVGEPPMCPLRERASENPRLANSVVIGPLPFPERIDNTAPVWRR